MVTLEQIRKKMIESIKNCGISQTELAHRLGINPATVSHYVCGDKMPALDTFANLCAILEEDANDILCIDEYKA